MNNCGHQADGERSGLHRDKKTNSSCNRRICSVSTNVTSNWSRDTALFFKSSRWNRKVIVDKK